MQYFKTADPEDMSYCELLKRMHFLKSEEHMNPISVCIITKNEENHLEECLKRIRPYDWEIVVVDTGSTDRTREIAVQYADKVCDFTWCNDFAAARNYSISQANRPFILILDSDEYLTNVDMPKLLSEIPRYSEDIGRILICSHFEGNQKDSLMAERMERFFAKKSYEYAYPVHEQIVYRKENSSHNYQVYDIPLSVEHFGYLLSPEDKIAKVKRNNDILLARLEQEPDDAYVLFQIGQSYFMLDEYDEAFPYFKRSFELHHDLSVAYVHTLVVSYGSTLLNIKQMDEATSLLKFIQSEDYHKNADFCCLCGSIYFHKNQYGAAMGEFVRALYGSHSVNQDATHNIPLYNIGLINEILGDPQEALVNYKMCVNFPMAERRIQMLEHQSP
jgi:glycosyltransferase involved in cell wall biosynthesis